MAKIDIASEVAGIVWQVTAQVGQALGQDETVVIVESMKMEIPVSTPHAGTVVEILVEQSDILAAGAIVARLEVA